MSKFKSIVDQYEKFGLRKGEIKEQLEYIQAKQEQLKTLLNWAERQHVEAVSSQMLKHIEETLKKQT